MAVTGLDFQPVSGQSQTMFGAWLLVVLAYGWSAALLALGIYALAMRDHSSRRATIIIKVLGVLVRLWGLWELFATTATLMRSPSGA
jgi:sulfite exporter TauE/SafE